MVNLEQIHLLEDKINKACDLIHLLKKENGSLRRTIESSQRRMAELERFINQFKTEQTEIESGIVSALKKLDELEDGIADTLDKGDTVEEVEKHSDPKSTRERLAVEKKSQTLQTDANEPGEGSSGLDTGVLRDSGNGDVQVEKTSAGEQEAELDIF
jgi:chromosome segregation ATPase